MSGRESRWIQAVCCDLYEKKEWERIWELNPVGAVMSRVPDR